MSLENYPALGSGTKYYKKLGKYVTKDGLSFDYTKEPTVSEFEEFIGDKTTKVGKCLLNIKENSNGSSRATIDGSNFLGSLVTYEGLHPYWDDDTSEWCYFIVYDGHIVKIGMTTTSLIKRFRSYLCGYRRTMKKGSPSTTNFVINEVNYAALRCGVEVEIYGVRLGKKINKIEKWGLVEYIASKLASGYEGMLTTLFKNLSGHIPVLSKQHFVEKKKKDKKKKKKGKGKKVS